MTGNSKNLIVIVGPTAVGKTSLSIRFALTYKTEILSADSRQFYRELTIGTAKPTPAELKLVPHHFIDSHSITEIYNAAHYGEDALVLMNGLFKVHDDLVMCGGSGLYIKAVCEGFDDVPDVPSEIREDLNEHYQKNGIGWLQEKMMTLDPEHYKNIDQQNPHRLIRALEVKIGTGSSISSFQNKAKASRPFNIIKIGLTMDRKELYERIDARMDQMIADGLFDEAHGLLPYKNHNALQTVGYQEIFDYFEGKYDKAEAIRLLKQNSRRYAKRQLTWFMRDESITWFDANHAMDIDTWLDEKLLKK